ncbi:MAG: RIP metalloprotease RseP [Lentimicrobium sp.]|jgi:regulator of sigma E protease|nr:RIP metalloprotease RseP [Lentimicrobium sp.]MDD2527291.1 RIP metalloprotease RseP [Lentimicrobiaceae bacterium]MDD4597144.1 RIP metalloprotease RseP [Lentimicrobiaceae bacterium]MDY0026732.1 RIP metalloprotease RseP [Lentimicrobium sp.]
MEILIKAAQLLLSLSILVIFHEFGHFITAKLFKTRVEKFYLFFNPWFSLFKFKKGETEYGMGWLPLGGYVKIAGMIDESMDKEQMDQPAQPWEFRSKPAWQRLIIMLGGVTVNILLAIAIYIGMLWAWGEKYLPVSEVKYGIVVDSTASDMGLRNGDFIVSVDHEEVEDFFKIPAKIILDNARTIQVIRDGKPFEIEIPGGQLSKLLKNQSGEFINVRMPFVIAGFQPGSVAEQAGLRTGDRIIAINDSSTLFFDEFRSRIPAYKNKTIQLGVVRDKDTLSFTMDIPETGLIGAYTNPSSHFVFHEKEYGLLAAIPAGFTRTWKGVGNYLKQLKLLFSPEVKAYESVGGFITIGSIFPSSWDWQAFWSLTAFLSIMLAILNVLPIPALDGGHVMFLFYEMVSGRKPSDKFMEFAQIVGMVLLFGLLIFANGNDIVKLFK